MIGQPTVSIHWHCCIAMGTSRASGIADTVCRGAREKSRQQPLTEALHRLTYGQAAHTKSFDRGHAGMRRVSLGQTRQRSTMSRNACVAIRLIVILHDPGTDTVQYVSGDHSSICFPSILVFLLIACYSVREFCDYHRGLVEQWERLGQTPYRLLQARSCYRCMAAYVHGLAMASARGI